MMTRNGLVFFKMKHSFGLLIFSLVVFDLAHSRPQIDRDAAGSAPGSAAAAAVTETSDDLSSRTKIVSVKTQGLSCIDEYNMPCIYANNRNSILRLTVENLFHRRLSVALTSQPPAQVNEYDSFGAPLCNPALMLEQNHIEANEIVFRTEIDMPLYLPNSTQGLAQKDYFFCLYSSRQSGLWIHQGNIPIKIKSMFVTGSYVPAAVITGVLAEGDRTYVEPNGINVIPADVDVTIRLFGFNFSVATSVRFTTHQASRWERCDDFKSSKGFLIHTNEVTDHSARITVNLPEMNSGDEVLYMCVKESDKYGDLVRWIHQGSEHWMVVQTQGRLLPMWLQILIICTLLILSGLFSGLNLGLMALDRTDLKIIENTGSEEEKKYAKTISPVRKLGNYLLCTLLLGNVLVNSSLTILLDDLTSGLIAIIGSTLAIVIFGEIVPQAICSRHGLFIGAHTVWITKFFMLVTFPLSFPISKLLDLILGQEIGNFYNRERLKELIRVTNEYHDLQKDEVNIISGALELSKKTVSDVMTKLDDVFMIPFDTLLDFETMSHIMRSGYTRVPVYEKEKCNVVAILNIKDLAFVDPDDNTPVKTVCQFYNHPISFVFQDTTLAVILEEFKKGSSHMAFVQRINNEGEGDPFYEIQGVVTLEDVIEEIIQSEINDETDVLSDNRRRLKRKETQLKQDFSSFAQQGENRVQISPQLTLATFQYLSTALDQFKPSLVSPTVLKRLMTQDIYVQMKAKSKESPYIIYECGKPADYFILILEGKVQVTIGKENLVFECGPFTYFGVQTLAALIMGDGSATPIGTQIPTSVSAPSSIPSINSPSPQQSQPQPTSQNQGTVNSSVISGIDQGSNKIFIPDYTVQALQEVLFMRLKRHIYQACLKATLMEAQHKLDPSLDDPFKHLDKLQSDSLERLNGSFRRTTAPNSARSSLRSMAETPEQWNNSLRSVYPNPGSPFYTSSPVTLNRNRAFSQPEVVSKMTSVPEIVQDHDVHKTLNIDHPGYVARSSNRDNSDKLNSFKVESYNDQNLLDYNPPAREHIVVDVDKNDEQDNVSFIRNGQITFPNEVESTL